jgi:hypothetical protein
MKIVNNSDGKPYYSQRNNELNPGSSCNVTSMISGLVSASWPLPAGKYKQPEDNLLEFIRNNAVVQKRWAEVCPKRDIPPNQIHETLCLGTNLWIEHLGGPKIELLWQLSIGDIKSAIDNGGAVVISGRFQDQRSSEIGHIVPVVGYQSTDDGEVTHVILDDPWGDYESLYSIQRGDDIFMPISDWLANIRDQHKPLKFGHVIKRYYRAAA